MRNSTEYTVSIIIPCYNEEGNVAECVARTSSVGAKTEIIVVSDGSTDATETVARTVAAQDSRVRVISYEKNRGKAVAIAEAVRVAQGDIVMILDADMTVAPEEMATFYDVFCEKKVGLLIGTRFQKKFSRKAMRFINRVSNRLSAMLFSMVLRSRVTDTLCGTKVMWRKDALEVSWGHCRWGDFDILRYAALNKLSVAELPVVYGERLSGVSSMHFFPDGCALYARALEIVCEVLWHEIACFFTRKT